MLVHEPVVSRAEQEEVVGARRPTVGPVADVVRVEEQGVRRGDAGAVGVVDESALELLYELFAGHVESNLAGCAPDSRTAARNEVSVRLRCLRRRGRRLRGSQRHHDPARGRGGRALCDARLGLPRPGLGCSYTWRREETIRIMSARTSTPSETRTYAEGAT